MLMQRAGRCTCGVSRGAFMSRSRCVLHLPCYGGSAHSGWQACDVYDTDYLQAFADAVVDVAMRVLDEE